jgi:hypothetical protein
MYVTRNDSFLVALIKGKFSRNVSMDQPGLSPSNQFSVTNLIIKLHSKFEIINHKVDGRRRKCNLNVSNAPAGQFCFKK